MNVVFAFISNQIHVLFILAPVLEELGKALYKKSKAKCKTTFNDTTLLP